MSWIIKEGSEDLGLDCYVGESHGNEACCIHEFRLLDDDDIVYFHGLESDSSSFDPIDEFGIAFGCTDIQYFENGKWESL